MNEFTIDCSNSSSLSLHSYEVKTEAGGIQKLIVKNLTLEDEAQYTCRIGDRETSCKLMVDEGRSCDSVSHDVYGCDILCYV